MGAGKIIALISSILGILSVALFYVMPEIFFFWRFDYGAAGSFFLGGFGSHLCVTIGGEFGPESAEDTTLLFLGILVIAGSALALMGGFFENKSLTILGGLLMILGPILLVNALFLELGYFEDMATLIPPDDNIFFGSVSGADWGLDVSFFLAIGGGVLGIIGGATFE